MPQLQARLNATGPLVWTEEQRHFRRWGQFICVILNHPPCQPLDRTSGIRDYFLTAIDPHWVIHPSRDLSLRTSFWQKVYHHTHIYTRPPHDVTDFISLVSNREVWNWRAKNNPLNPRFIIQFFTMRLEISNKVLHIPLPEHSLKKCHKCIKGSQCIHSGKNIFVN